MHKISLSEAGACLTELVEEVASGEEVIITHDNGSAFKIVPIATGTPRPHFGSARGQVKMSDDFDTPLEDFDTYAP